MFAKNSIPRFYIKLKNKYGLDARALSLMRIGVAVVLLIDLCVRVTSLTAHYTQNGAVPFNEVGLFFWKQGYFSLFQFCDTYWFASCVFIVTGIVYFFLLIGYKTRLFTIASWLLLSSLQNRNTIILQGGDDLLRLILFFAAFLPWGNFYSIDNKKVQLLNTKTIVLSAATVGYILLLFSVYFFSGILKSGTEWNNEGTALHYALSLDQMAWPLGKMLLHQQALLKFLTIFVRWFEIVVPFLLFIPFKNSKFRSFFILVITVFQLSIALTLFVGLFYLIALVSLLGLLPTTSMNWVDKKLNIARTPIKKPQNLFFLKKISTNYYFNTIKNSFLFYCIALCFIWNLGTIKDIGISIKDNFSGFGYALRLNQSWGMFAPTVMKDDGWYIMEAITNDSLKIDINRNGAMVDYTKPISVLAYIKDDRWRKYLENYLFTYNDFMRPYLCNYLLNDWNKNHSDKKIISLDIIYMKEISVLPNEKQIVTKEILCSCGKD